MGKLMNEQQVLKKLKIKDFRHITKDKVMELASMLPDVDPEVAKRALAQFPEFVNAGKDILYNFKETLEKEIEANNQSVINCYDVANKIIISLQLELDKEDITFEQRITIIDKMLEVSKMINDKDSQNKQFLLKLGSIAATCALAGLAILATPLGSDIKLPFGNEK